MTDHFLLLQLLAYQTRRLESDIRLVISTNQQTNQPNQPTNKVNDG